MIFGELVEFVDDIDQQKFGRQLPRNVQPTFETHQTPAQRKGAVAFLVIDHALVVELRGSQSKLVVRTWRSHNKVIGLQKRSDEFMLVRRGLSESKSSRAVVEPIA